MFRIEKITLNQLSDFIKSDKFVLLEDKPISSLRVASYLNNSKANTNDIVLYMAFDGEKLVGYRTIWRDTYTLSKETKSFGWLSGNWVHSEYRRKGVSTSLFDEVYNDWNGALMYTNYAVNSKLLYDKTGCFQKIKSLVGTRFYIRFCLGDILVKKHKLFSYLKGFFIFFDLILNFLFDVRFLFFKEKEISSEIKKDEVWNTKIDSFLKEFKEKEFFKRDEKEYKWIQDFPWVKTNESIKKESKKYYFSLYAKDFQNNYYTFYNEKGKLIAFIWLTFKDGHLKIPYVYFEKEQLNEVVDFILIKCKEERVKTIVVYNTAIEELLNKRMFSLARKRFYQNFFATKNITIIPEDIEKKAIQSGNGDVVFT